MKARRQMRILELVHERVVQTQQELTELLRREGIEVTQATVSRDIKELQLMKVPHDGGGYRYAPPADSNRVDNSDRERLERLLQDCVLGVNFSEQLIVVRTLSGTASAAGEALDHLAWPEVIGTIAGDNTLLLVIKPVSAVGTVMQRLQALIRR